MPTVHVRSVQADAAAARGGLPEIARAVARAVPCSVDGVWVTFQVLEVETLGERYVDGDGRIAYVDVWIRPRDSDPGAAPRALVAACESTAAMLGIPVEDVWGTLGLVEPGRVFAGGGLVE